MLHKRPKSARNLLKSEWNKPTTPKVDRAQQKKMIQEFQRRDQEEVERRLQVRMKLVSFFFFCQFFFLMLFYILWRLSLLQEDESQFLLKKDLNRHLDSSWCMVLLSFLAFYQCKKAYIDGNTNNLQNILQIARKGFNITVSFC